VAQETVGCHLLSIHNIAYQVRILDVSQSPLFLLTPERNSFLFQMNLMKRIRQSIAEDNFPRFVQDFMKVRFPNKSYPQWIVDALQAVGITLD